MSKILVLVLLPVLVFAQYYGERTTAQSFEHSDLYFQSHFFNTYGIYQFKDVTPGLIDDPFLNLYINPSNFSFTDTIKTKVYLEFRGDRTEAPILDFRTFPMRYYSYSIYPYYAPDPRWLSQTRSEPEPIVSFGILTNPISELTNKLVFGFSYQLIHKNEPFYNVPYFIYNSRYLYDSFGAKISSLEDVPVEDRYSGADEMTNEGHLYSAFLAYQVSNDFQIGLGLNGVMHDRDGKYGDSYNDEYGDTDNREWSNASWEDRNQNYDHVDLNMGFSYYLTPKLQIGAKVGRLSGDAEQTYNSSRDYKYIYNTPHVSEEWSYYFSEAKTNQNWEHKGNSNYLGFNFQRKVDDSRTFSGYYRYSYSDIDVTTKSSIIDTSFNDSRYISSWDTAVYDHLGESATRDIRSGSGQRKKYIHQAMINYRWQLTPVTQVSAAIYAYKNDTEVEITEPALIRRYSKYESYKDGILRSYSSFRVLEEDKQLLWNYTSKLWSIQIPVIINFQFSPQWGMMLGVNRILESWTIEDQTTAYFNFRRRNDNGVIETETNFGERYTQPTEKISEDYTDIITGFNVTLAEEFKIRLLIDPEFEHEFRIAQWWLGFEAEL